MGWPMPCACSHEIRKGVPTRDAIMATPAAMSRAITGDTSRARRVARRRREAPASPAQSSEGRKPGARSCDGSQQVPDHLAVIERKYLVTDGLCGLVALA